MAGSASAVQAPTGRWGPLGVWLGARWNEFLGQIPLAKEFTLRRDAFIKKAGDEIKELLEGKVTPVQDDNLNSDTKWALQQHRKERAKADFWQSVIWDWYRGWLWITLAGGLVAAAALSHNLYPGVHGSLLRWVLIAILAAVFAAGLLLLLLLPFAFLSDLIDEYFSPGRSFTSWLLAAAMVLVSGLYAFRRGGFATPQDWVFVAEFCGMTAGLLWIVSVGSLKIATAAVDAWISRSFSRKEPSGSIALDLFSVLEYRAWDYSWKYSVRARREWAYALERAAVCMEFDLPRQMACGNAGLDLATAEAMAGRAAAVRDLSKRILLSSPDKAKLIRGELVETLARVCTLDWESLPLKGASVLTKRDRATVWLRSTGRGILLAMIPILLLIIIHRYPIGIGGEQLSWANLVLLVWLGLALNGLIDPDYGTTSKMLETLGKFGIPFVKKRKEASSEDE